MFSAIHRYVFPVVPPQPLTSVHGVFTAKKTSNNRLHEAFRGDWGVQSVRVTEESEGSSATVVRTRNPALVAKCFEVGKDQNAEKEAEILCYLRRKNVPNVSQLYAVSYGSLKSGTILIINNAGMDLQHWGRQLRLEDISRIAKQVLESLVFLEEDGLVHNDIKLENICYTKEKGTTLIDWEGATFPRQDQNKIATFSYLSPEACLDLHVDEKERCKRDIWAVAVVIFNLLANDGLFVNNCGEETQSAVLLDAIEQRVGLLPEEMADRAKSRGMLIPIQVDKEKYTFFPPADNHIPAFQALENERESLVTPESMHLYSRLGIFVLDLLRVNPVERPNAEEALEQHFSDAALARAAQPFSFYVEGAVFPLPPEEVTDDEADEQQVLARLFPEKVVLARDRNQRAWSV